MLLKVNEEDILKIVFNLSKVHLQMYVYIIKGTVMQIWKFLYILVIILVYIF